MGEVCVLFGTIHAVELVGASGLRCPSDIHSCDDLPGCMRKRCAILGVGGCVQIFLGEKAGGKREGEE